MNENKREYGSPAVERELARYERYSAADQYLLFVTQEGKTYTVIKDRLNKRWLYIGRTKNNEPALKMYMLKNAREALIQRGGNYRGSEQDVLGGAENKGIAAEAWAAQHYCHEDDHKHDSTPFYERGDLRIFGNEVQVKYYSATICKLSTLDKLDRGEVLDWEQERVDLEDEED